MLKRIRPKLTYANVISTTCLFILLGGGAYAATKLPKNSVGTAQLKKNAVTGAKVKDGSLTGTDIDVGTLGTVPAATSAATAGSAGTAQSADRAGVAGSAGTAGSAETAKRADSATTAGSAGSAGTATRADSAARADSATHADSAGTADSATSAGTATTAGNALKLEGMTAAELILVSKLHCPAAMALAAGVCVDEQPRAAAPLYEAFQLCAEENFRLPTEGELIAFVNQYLDVDSSLTEWIEPEVVHENQFQGVLLTVSKAGYSPSTFDRSASRPYRCVTAATNLAAN